MANNSLKMSADHIQVEVNITDDSNGSQLEADYRLGIIAMEYIKILGTVVGVLATVGMVTNILSLVVFTRVREKTSTTFLLQVLAIADSMFLFMNLIIFTVMAAFLNTGQYQRYFQIFGPVWPYMKGVMEITRDFSVWMVIVVTMDRYIAIYYPLSASKLCRVASAATGVVLLLIYVICFSIPRFVSISPKTSQEGEVHLTSVGRNIRYQTIYFSIDSVVNLMIPMFLVVFMNIRIVQALRRASKRRLVMSRCEEEKQSCTTMTLVIIAAIFVICETPKTIHILCEIIAQALSKHDEHTQAWLIRAGTVSNIFQNINSFINFFIYCFIARRFRMILSRLVKCQQKKRQSLIQMKTEKPSTF
jgi:hypothetical protein